MWPLNNDMDELYRKAANDYPLKTNSSNWEKISEHLPEKENIGNAYKRKLFAASFLCGSLILLPLVIAVSHQMLITMQSEAIDTKQVPLPLSVNLPYHGSKNGAENFRITKSTYSPLSSAVTSMQTSISLAGGSYNATDVALIPHEDYVAHQTIIAANDRTLGTVSPSLIVLDNKSAVSQSEKNEAQDFYKEETHHLNVKSSASKFYLGGIIAPEISSVKFQAFTKVGFNGGFVAGYNINKKLQFEIAFTLAQKFYSSDGKYAAKNSLRKDNAQINNVDGFASITALPVNFRYNINNSTKNKFSVSAGAVSYIIHKEKYNYEYVKNGVEKKGFRRYNESSENLFSNVQLSIGYEHALSNNTYLRVEPYAGIPLNGIGISDLPVTNFGVNIGVIKYIK